MVKRATVVTWFACFLAFANAFSGTLREKFEQTYAVEKGGEVFLINSNGSVTVSSWDKNEVQVFAEKVVRSDRRGEAEEIIKEIQIEVTHDGNYLKIKTDAPKFANRFWNAIFGDDVSVAVNYRLQVPQDLKLEVSNVNGSVEIAEISGEIRAISTNGRVEMTRCKGVVDVKTTNGAINVELLEVTENPEMLFKTTNGSITVVFPEELSAEIDASTTNGSIRTDFPITVQGEVSRRKLRGVINDGGGRIDMRTTNGSITIRQR